MIIDNSKISMTSTRSSFHYASVKFASIEERSSSAIQLDLSKDAKSLVEQVEEHEKNKQEQLKKQEQENEKQQTLSMNELLRKQTKEANNTSFPRSSEDFKLSLLRMLLRALNKKVHGDDVDSYENFLKNDCKDNPGFCLTSNNQSAKEKELALNSKYFPAVANVVGAAPISMTRTTVVSSFEAYYENTAFEGKGVVNTTDGRSIEFGITLEMTQNFTHQYENYSQQIRFFMDPLVINLDSNITHITDQKFLFDLDSDGEKEEISFAKDDSGFLALDKNDDGVINDGSELFGTKSGDGFKDLAQYDSDHNGWIDEADDIYSKLKIWTKDENGKDYLINLKEADVGAIYLGNASTDFSLFDDTYYNKNGQIRSTGIYLKESGGAGTIQHVDLAI